MLIFFQQLCLLLFLWLLKLVDGLMEIFSAISGITDVTYKGEKVNIIEFLAGDSTVNTIFWCIFILAIGLTCIFTIAALIKNMINSQRPFHRIYLTIAVFQTGQCLFPPVVDGQQNSHLFHYESSLSTAINAL